MADWKSPCAAASVEANSSTLLREGVGRLVCRPIAFRGPPASSESQSDVHHHPGCIFCARPASCLLVIAGAIHGGQRFTGAQRGGLSLQHREDVLREIKANEARANARPSLPRHPLPFPPSPSQDAPRSARPRRDPCGWPLREVPAPIAPGSSNLFFAGPRLAGSRARAAWIGPLFENMSLAEIPTRRTSDYRLESPAHPRSRR